MNFADCLFSVYLHHYNKGQNEKAIKPKEKNMNLENKFGIFIFPHQPVFSDCEGGVAKRRRVFC